MDKCMNNVRSVRIYERYIARGTGMICTYRVGTLVPVHQPVATTKYCNYRHVVHGNIFCE